MAKKRMFSLDVVDTDRFLNLSLTARYLYYELGMRADDDGFVANPHNIIRLTGCRSDDLISLSNNGYLFIAKTGVIIIRDWNINNLIRSDRYKATIYQEEKKEYESFLKDFLGIPKIENGIPKIENGIPKFENGIPKIENGIPKIENGIPKIENGIPKIDELSNSANDKENSFGIPKIENGIPSIEQDRQGKIRLDKQQASEYSDLNSKGVKDNLNIYSLGTTSANFSDDAAAASSCVFDSAASASAEGLTPIAEILPTNDEQFQIINEITNFADEFGLIESKYFQQAFHEDGANKTLELLKFVVEKSKKSRRPIKNFVAYFRKAREENWLGEKEAIIAEKSHFAKAAPDCPKCHGIGKIKVCAKDDNGNPIPGSERKITCECVSRKNLSA